MSKATKERNPKGRAGTSDDTGTATEKPGDSEVSFEHLLRQMVIDRDEARNRRG